MNTNLSQKPTTILLFACCFWMLGKRVEAPMESRLWSQPSLSKRAPSIPSPTLGSMQKFRYIHTCLSVCYELWFTAMLASTGRVIILNPMGLGFVNSYETEASELIGEPPRTQPQPPRLPRPTTLRRTRLGTIPDASLILSRICSPRRGLIPATWARGFGLAPAHRLTSRLGWLLNRSHPGFVVWGSR